MATRLGCQPSSSSTTPMVGTSPLARAPASSSRGVVVEGAEAGRRGGRRGRPGWRRRRRRWRPRRRRARRPACGLSEDAGWGTATSTPVTASRPKPSARKPRRWAGVGEVGRPRRPGRRRSPAGRRSRTPRRSPARHGGDAGRWRPRSGSSAPGGVGVVEEAEGGEGAGGEHGGGPPRRRRASGPGRSLHGPGGPVILWVPVVYRRAADRPSEGDRRPRGWRRPGRGGRRGATPDDRGGQASRHRRRPGRWPARRRPAGAGRSDDGQGQDQRGQDPGPGHGRRAGPSSRSRRPA